MRTMLLSFSPRWYEDLSSGRKIYEHRKRFYNDEVLAYIYLGIPHRQIVAKVILGKKINMSDWLALYEHDAQAIERIKDYMSRSNVAMPIKSFQAIEPIDVRKMEREITGFRVPISYMFIDDKPKVFDYIKSREVVLGDEINHKFENITSDMICRC